MTCIVIYYGEHFCQINDFIQAQCHTVVRLTSPYASYLIASQWFTKRGDWTKPKNSTATLGKL